MNSSRLGQKLVLTNDLEQIFLSLPGYSVKFLVNKQSWGDWGGPISVCSSCLSDVNRIFDFDFNLECDIISTTNITGMTPTYDMLAAEGREMVDEIVCAMRGMSWQERRDMVTRMLRVADAAIQVRATVMPDQAWSRFEVIEGVVGNLLAAVLERLDANQVKCGDSAHIFALSARLEHRRAAREWRVAHPNPRPREGTCRTLH